VLILVPPSLSQPGFARLRSQTFSFTCTDPIRVIRIIREIRVVNSCEA